MLALCSGSVDRHTSTSSSCAVRGHEPLEPVGGKSTGNDRKSTAAIHEAAAEDGDLRAMISCRLAPARAPREVVTAAPGNASTTDRVAPRLTKIEVARNLCVRRGRSAAHVFGIPRAWHLGLTRRRREHPRSELERLEFFPSSVRPLDGRRHRHTGFAACEPRHPDAKRARVQDR